VSLRPAPLVRDLHLYAGLFLSPFVLLFAVSVVALVHSWRPGAAAPVAKRDVTDVVIPAGFETLRGRAQLAAAQDLLAGLGVQGEIGALRQIPRDRRFILTVAVPGRETTVDLSAAGRTAAISTRPTGLLDAAVYLHRMPGPHNADLRGNAAFMVAWRWLADTTVWLLLFLAASGVYLWAMLRTGRRLGLALLAAGAVSCGGLIYALVA
jgi:hypothetical protein